MKGSRSCQWPLVRTRMKRETRAEGGRRRGLFVRSVRSSASSAIVGHPSIRPDPRRPHRKGIAAHRPRPDRCKVIKYLAGPGVFFSVITPGFRLQSRSIRRIGRTGASQRPAPGRTRGSSVGTAGSAPGATSRASEHSACARTLDRIGGGKPLTRIWPRSFTFQFHPHAGFAVHDASRCPSNDPDWSSTRRLAAATKRSVDTAGVSKSSLDETSETVAP